MSHTSRVCPATARLAVGAFFILGCRSEAPARAAAPADSAAATAAAPAPKALTVKALNDHLLYFFDGRDSAGKRFSPDWNWKDDAAMKLGVGTYVIHRGDQALVYDAFTEPAQAAWARQYLTDHGIKHFRLILSHWHLDHVGGNAVYQGDTIISTQAARDALVQHRDSIQAGTLWGPPAIDPLVLPTVTFPDRMDLDVGGIKVEAHRVNIHSKDTNVLYLPADRILLAGDALEDEVTYMTEPEGLPDHVRNLRKLRAMDLAVIYPNHGDPQVIMGGGYDRGLIDATIAYDSAMVARAHDKGFLQLPMEDFVRVSLTKGWVHRFAPYEDVHKQNLKLVHDYYATRALPKM